MVQIYQLQHSAHIFIAIASQSSMRSQKSLQILRRVHTNSEDNIQTNHSPLARLKRARLNTIQNQEELLMTKMDRRKSSFKLPSTLHSSPPKYYQSRLVLSCETWSVYNVAEQKYKRGWKPIRIVNFTGFLKLILLKLHYHFQRQFPWMARATVRVNRYLLRQQLSKKNKPLVQQLKLRQKQEKQQDPYLLAQNTIIPLKDLIIGNLYTEYEDLSEYSIIFLGAVLRDIRQGQKHLHKCYSLEEEDKEKGRHAERDALVSLLVSYANNWLKTMDYSSSSVTQTCEFFSSPEQATRIFADLLQAHPQFQRLLSRREIASTIKYQMGYRFYEQRKLKFTNDWPSILHHWVIKTKNKLNYAVLSYNRVSHNVIALYDCKYSMEDIDLKRIQDFLEVLAKPIVAKKEERDRGVKLPILKITE